MVETYSVLNEDLKSLITANQIMKIKSPRSGSNQHSDKFSHLKLLDSKELFRLAIMALSCEKVDKLSIFKNVFNHLTIQWKDKSIVMAGLTSMDSEDLKHMIVDSENEFSNFVQILILVFPHKNEQECSDIEKTVEMC